jgi:dienelactone hydrolase
MNRLLCFVISLVGLSCMMVIAGCGGASGGGGGNPTPPPISVAVGPASAMVQAGATQQFTATVSNDSADKGVTWTVSCSAAPCGKVSPTSTASGVATTYTASPTAPASALTVTITATSVTNGSATASATVTVPAAAAISVSVAPPNATVQPGGTGQFTATVTNDAANKGVTWTLVQDGSACSPSCGTVAPTGTTSGTPTTYTPPANAPVNSVVTLTATAVTETTISASATITIAAVPVTLIPNMLQFGKVVVHTSSRVQTATLTNTGSATLSISSVTITGDDSKDFSQTNTCGADVDAGLSCSISVVFTPTAGGDRTAEVSINDNGDSPLQLAVLGYGYTKAKPDDENSFQSALIASRFVAVPEPTGPNFVGTRVMDLTDTGRADPYRADDAKRELLVRFWYPSSLSQRCKTAEYAPPQVWDYFSQLVEVPAPEVTTNSCWEAPIADGKHPVVVFTPGYTATFTDYTFIFEDLASRGYVVASVDHTYEATAVEFPDGRLVKSVLGSHLGGALHGDDDALSFATSVRLDDLSFVVDELGRISAQTGSPLLGKLDMTRVALAGHSMGGVTSYVGVQRDSRFKVGIILDGFVPGSMIRATETPTLILAAGRENWDADECRLWSDLRGPRLSVNLVGAEHETPSDAVWLARGAIKTGPMGTDKTIAAIRDYIAAFLDTHLRGAPASSLLTGPSSYYPDAIVTTREETVCRQP